MPEFCGMDPDPANPPDTLVGVREKPGHAPHPGPDRKRDRPRRFLHPAPALPASESDFAEGWLETDRGEVAVMTLTANL